MARGLATFATLATISSLALALALTPSPAQAFCGFYVAGADAKLFNDATMVVMMREGRRTVLSMQNSYQGPPEDFAMIVPVPTVLAEDDVEILPASVFDRVDHLAAPRLVEYWEIDPCEELKPIEILRGMPAPSGRFFGAEVESEHSVVIEAQFEVGEYEVVILSAGDSMGLDTWLREQGYSIPAGAEPLLRPYVQSDYKFFVAKVDVDKVKFVDGRAALSPLRVHYDSDDFNLPIRLGLINAGGPQDLIVHILASQRYEAANYANVAIPTNIEVKDQTRERFGSFYASLFDDTLAQHPGAVVTEYAWSAGSCDPCPEPPLDMRELATLGGDVLQAAGGGQPNPGNTVLTRLHARYDSAQLGNDLVFRVADPIVGGREHVIDDNGALERGAVTSGVDNFQARYIIRHRWKGKIACKKPVRNRWGGPWKGSAEAGSASAVAEDLAFVKRGVALGSYVQTRDADRTQVELLSEGDLSLSPAPVPEPEPEPASDPDGDGSVSSSGEGSSPDQTDAGAMIDDGPDRGSGCAHCAVDSEGRWAPIGLGLLVLGALALGRRRRYSA